MILMRQIYFRGHWKGWALKIETFLGPEMASSEVGFFKLRDLDSTSILIQPVDLGQYPPFTPEL